MKLTKNNFIFMLECMIQLGFVDHWQEFIDAIRDPSALRFL